MSQVSAAAGWLQGHTAMSQEASRHLAWLAPALLAQLPQKPTFCLAIGGPPGSGKSTLAGLQSYLLNESGRPSVRLSLDDYYLGRSQREALARRRHPLLRRRGVPGTHDWARLLHDLDCLREGRTAGLKLPAFDKSTDDTVPEDRWRSIDFTPSCLIVEGWCIGPPAQDPSALAEPVNDLEREQDSHCEWREFVNDELARYHRDLAQRVDGFWYIQVPGWDCVLEWRWQQERELADPHFHSRQEVAEFLAPFERIVSHTQLTSEHWADWRLAADPRHRLQVMA